MATSPTLSHPPVLFHLSDEANDLRVRTIVAADGSVDTLSYQVGESDPLEFSGAEITTVPGGELVRATVALGESHTERITFELVLPLVALGDDVSEEGPFGVRAAGLRITSFIVNTNSIPPGPQQEIEAIQLFARAIAHHPEG